MDCLHGIYNVATIGGKAQTLKPRKFKAILRWQVNNLSVLLLLKFREICLGLSP